MYVNTRHPRLGIEPVTTTAVVTAALPVVTKLFKRKKKKRRRREAAPAPPPALVTPMPAPALGLPGWVWPVAIGGSALVVGALVFARR